MLMKSYHSGLSQFHQILLIHLYLRGITPSIMVGEFDKDSNEAVICISWFGVVVTKAGLYAQKVRLISGESIESDLSN